MTTVTSDFVIDVTDQTFAAEVLERSKTTPVIVDFWAEWCGPCRMLGPVLEKLAAEYQGGFILAKLDVDSNPAAARQFQVQGIPAVKAFKDGRLVSEFTGAQPEPQVRKFIEALVPSEADLLAKQAFEWEANDQPAMAETNYRAALEKKPDHYPAKVGLGRVLLNQGKFDEGIALLQSIPAGVPERAPADALLAAAEFRRHAAGHTEAELQAKIEANPGDVAARYALACLYAGQQKFARALDEFLEVVRRDRSYNDDGARKAMLAIFTILGEGDLVRNYRQKLANTLF
ncbi:MAG: thioredoxin [Chloroflexi bacterium]|nr:MAG: thioredoxin [Chloroflexota bacterium]